MHGKLHTHNKRGEYSANCSFFPPPCASLQTRQFGNSGAKRGTKGIKRGTSASADTKGDRDASTSGSTSDPPPAIVLRAPKVQAQTRLHGRPASSFFARAQALASAGALLDGTPPLPAQAAGVAALNTAEEQIATTPTIAECSAAAAVTKSVVKPHPTRSVAGNESTTSMASVVSAASVASRLGACASAPGSCTSGSASLLEASIDSASSASRIVEEDTIPGCTTTRCKPRSVTRSAMSSRSTFSRAGQRGAGRRAGNGGGGWNVPTVSVGPNSLDGELMLLDGILHDQKVRTWVEKTLVPAKKR